MPKGEDSQAFESFPDSRWSVLREAAQPDRRAEILRYLARNYWKPIYTYIRRPGFGHDDAKDLTQECFVRLGSGDTLAQMKGDSRFRCWLRALAGHVIVDHRREARSRKRGGAAAAIDIAEIDVAAEGTPEEAFDREWFRSVELQAVDLLRRELRGPRNARKLQVLECYLLPRIRGEKAAPSFEEVAKALDCTRDEVEYDVRRIRGMAHLHLCRVLHDTVTSSDDIHAEFEALRKQP